MASVNRIDSVYDVASIAAEQQKVEALVRASIEQIKQARGQSIDLNVNTKTFDDFSQKIKQMQVTLDSMNKTTDQATRASFLLAKQKEAEANAHLANTKATIAATRETERQEKATKKSAQTTKDAERPYKQLALAFKIAAERAQDLGTKYGVLDKRAKAAAKEANKLNDRLKEIDTSVGISNRRVGSYNETMEKFSSKLKNAATNFLALIGVVGVGDFFKGAIDEFLVMDKNVRLLQNTLNNLGVPQAFDRISASADRLAKQFTYLDNDDILKTFQQLAVYGKLTEDQINELIPVIIDFAAATGQDLNSATSVIIKSLEGNGKALKEFGINMKDASSTTEAFSLVMTQLAPKVKGVGQAFQESAEGGLAASQQRFKNLKEEIGSGLLPILNSVLSVLVNIAKGAFGAGKALTDAFSGKKSLPASILEGSDNKDIAFEANQVYQLEISNLKNFQKQLAEQQKIGRNLDKSVADIDKEFIKGLKSRLAERELAYEKIKQSTDKQAILSAIADIRGLQRALLELDKAGGVITPTTDPNKPFSSTGSKTRTTKRDDSEFQILKNSIELDKEFQKARVDNEKLSYEERLAALVAYLNRSQQLIEVTAQFELGAADLTAKERLKIESDKNAALIRLARDASAELEKVLKRDVSTGTERPGTSNKLPKSITEFQENFKKLQDEAIKKQKELKKALEESLTELSEELEGLIFDIFINQIERQKNAVQDQIDLLDAQKQKEIELANQTITNAQEKADAIAVIEARAQAKKEALERKQRQLDVQKARFEKARAITEIIQSTSLAVMKALAQFPGPAGIALGAVIGAIGAVQLARAIAQPIPKYKEGTDNHPGGLAIVGDGGKSETVVLPDGSLYRTPSKDTLVNMPAGSQVIPDYIGKPQNLALIQPVDNTERLMQGFATVVKAVKRIPQPIIHADRAWTEAHRQGSNFRTYLNRYK